MDNTVGSLTQFQESIITGTLLGDGYLRIMPGRRDAFLEVNHSYSAKEYVEWKFEALQWLCISKPQTRRGNGNRIAYRFFTKQHPELSILYERFYRNGNKIVPEDLILDPISLSVWFMDDGSRCRDSDVYFNTQQFSLEDQRRLLEKLNAVGLEGRLNKDKHYYRIRLLKSSVPRLREMIEYTIIPQMKYKVELNPVETCQKRFDRVLHKES